ncbi:MAG TPA: hypothetical protein P5057_10925, partial [Acidobacteriota bacterium]|nr:hypothetical protein [Acidobacteriota bacterium]
ARPRVLRKHDSPEARGLASHLTQFCLVEAGEPEDRRIPFCGKDTFYVLATVEPQQPGILKPSYSR